ncbi:MAG: ribbon-helix-helix protein, CopG family [Gammaproteobacteria bacterium]|nr:ribbon-helix-helix protein, CopG family [Gammaproteobacteria bacterium]
MSKTLTLRTDEQLYTALARHAHARNQTVSEAVREILRNALLARPLAARSGHLQGVMEEPADYSDHWRDTIRERNWRP